MEITWVSNETPDRLGQGGQRRQFFQISALARAGHTVTVVSLDGPQDDTSVRSVCDVHRLREPTMLHGRVALPWRRSEWRSTLARPADAVVIAHVESWPRFEWALPDGVPVVVDLHNVFSRWGRLDASEAARWRAAEARACSAADAVLVVSEREAAALVDTGKPVFLCGNGIDPSDWSNEPRPSSEPTLKLFGNWGWAPNTAGLSWFTRAVWPRVHAATGATCHIAGSGVDPAHTPAASGVTAHGRVEDLQGFLADAWAIAVPVMQGVGAPVKYPEALATGVRVVATADGAPDHRDLATVSDDPQVWVDVLSAWLDPATRPTVLSPDERAARAARLSWSATTGPLLQWLESLH